MDCFPPVTEKSGEIPEAPHLLWTLPCLPMPMQPDSTLRPLDHALHCTPLVLFPASLPTHLLPYKVHKPLQGGNKVIYIRERPF